jgi:predicted O-linked N-acetylglucosamine transferase (SPINDLY family)
MLSTFPFGGANSLIDAFLCGVPVITLEGKHVHELCDAWALHRVEMPDLITASTEDYETLALKLIGDDAERKRLSDHLRGFDVRGTFFADLQGLAKGAVLRAFEYVYARHEQIQASDERVINLEKQTPDKDCP